MPKASWFLAGFVFALAFGGLLVILPMAGIGAIAPTAPASDAPTPAAPPQVAPTPSAALPGLTWERRGAVEPPLGACDRLVVDAAWQIRYGPCDEGLRLAYFTESELATYQAYVLALQPFEYTGGDSLDAIAGGSVTLTLAGRGARPASPREQAYLALWAEQVYARVMGEELRANLLAQARLDLMHRRGVGIQDVDVISIEPVRWPDACLGLRHEGMACSRVITDGYQMVLVTQGERYEYRADLYGQVRAVAPFAPRMILPPLAP